MSRKGKLTNRQRIKAVKEYMNGEGNCISISKKYGIHRETLLSYVRRAQAEGIDLLRKSSHNKKYSKATKLAAVNEYLTGKGSQSEICTKYKITNKSILQKWIKWYNNGKDFKEHSSERGVTMSKGRKTTLEERTEIVATFWKVYFSEVRYLLTR